MTHTTNGELARQVTALNPQHILMWSGIDCVEIDLRTLREICNQCGLNTDSGCVITIPRDGWVVLVPQKL